MAGAIAQQAGYRVMVVEKQEFPRFMIGESLLPKCMEHFEAAGFLDVLKAQNYQVKRGVRFVRDNRVCWFDFANQYTESWSWTWQVPRAHFDKVLADALEARGVEIVYRTAVTAVRLLEDNSSETTLQHADGTTSAVRARFIIDASGFGRVLPRLFDLEKPSGMAPRKALFGHFTDMRRPTTGEGEQITLIIHKRDVWIWVIPFSDGNTSVGFVGDPAFINQFDGKPAAEQLRGLMQLVPFVAKRFLDQTPTIPASSIEAYAVSAIQTYGPGFAITGNSSEFIDPIFSSGVTFATESGMQAAQLACRELNGEKVQWKSEYADHMAQGVETFRTYVNLWYGGTLQDIFFFAQDNDVQGEIKRQICSVLAGNVWDMTNPFVNTKRDRILSSLAKLVKIY